MLFTIIIAAITIIAFIGFVIFKPTLSFGKIKVESFWLIALIGALLLILFQFVTLTEVKTGLFNNTSMNPIKLLTIFISMSGLSIMLDQLGFFNNVANFVLKKAGSSQFKIFLYLYLAVSFLTIFTSNDIIILTFTPIIIYFAKHAKINPLPLLITEFTAANTWSLMLIIGNPTNIYLASSFNISFLEYFQVMVIPTIVTGVFLFGLLYLIFKKDLKKEIVISEFEDEKLAEPFLVNVILAHLILCTILLSISSYIDIEMYLLCLIFFISASLFLMLYQILLKKEKPTYFLKSYKNIPWNLTFFVVSMFILVIGLNKHNVIYNFFQFSSYTNTIFGYGVSSFLTSNLINNIPMSVLYANIISHIPLNEVATIQRAIYSSIIGSNIGAYLTPIGALAGIMWMRMLKDEDIPLSFTQFIKYGIIIAIPTLFISLLMLNIVLF